MLTMEDAILNSSLNPKNYHMEWSANYPTEYLHKEGEVWQTVDIRSGAVRTIEAPKNEKIAHAELRGNNIVWIDTEGKEQRVTDFADKNIVCGQSVSRNEFGISGGLFPSPDNSLLAFYQKDESRVTTFPLLDITSRTGSLVEIKYPMNGMASERVQVGVYDVETKSVVYLSVTDFDEERYLTNVSWSPDSKTIYVQVLNRQQKEMHLNA